MKSAKKFFVLFAFAALVFSASSCNRGYGCPTWSLEEGATQATAKVVKALLPLIP